MAKLPKVGEPIPLSVVGRSDADMQSKQSTDGEMMNTDGNTMMQDVAQQIKALREQVQALQSNVAGLGAKVGKSVADGARATEARVSGTVETYPMWSVLVASLAGFVVARAVMVRPEPAHEDRIENLKSQLQALASQLPTHLKDRLRSTLR